MLEARNISIRFGGKTAVDNADLDLSRGEILAIVGRSGSGKTTLARAIAGHIPPDDGTLRLDGEILGRRRGLAQKRRIQMVFQDPFLSLNPKLTVGRVLAELVRLTDGKQGAEAAQRVEELLALVKLPAGIAEVYPRHLSGGQRQRVAIARALAVRPGILIADEPTSSLDVSIRAAVLDLFEEFRATLDLSTLFITHDLQAVRYLCRQVLVMDGGAIVERADTARFFVEQASEAGRRLVAAQPRLPAGSYGEAGPADRQPAA